MPKGKNRRQRRPKTTGRTAGRSGGGTRKRSGPASAWREAESLFDGLQAEIAFPLLGAITPEETVARLRGIVKGCPSFYPALLDLGVRLLAQEGATQEDDDEAIKLIDHGVAETLARLSDREEITDVVDTLTGNLERVWRPDVSTRVLRTAIERFPDKAGFHSDQAQCHVLLGDLDAAKESVLRAAALEPSDSDYANNLGWVHLAAGRVAEARKEFERALALDPDNDSPGANLEICRYLQEHESARDYWDYLLRPVDFVLLDGLREQEEWEHYEAECRDYNSDRLNAMAVAQIRRGRLRGLGDTVATLRTFFRFVEGVSQDCLLWDDIDFIQDHFSSIMHKFIFKHGDADECMLKDIFQALLTFHGFLADRGVNTKRQYADLERVVRRSEPELLAKVRRYGEVRHNPQISEEELEDIREELFEGDHAWPFL